MNQSMKSGCSLSLPQRKSFTNFPCLKNFLTPIYFHIPVKILLRLNAHQNNNRVNRINIWHGGITTVVVVIDEIDQEGQEGED